VVLDFGNRGLLGLEAPASLHGLALPASDRLRIYQQLGAIDLTIALFVGIHNVLGLGPVLRHASPELRRDLVPRLATGRELAAFALTEPAAGSNPRAIKTRARAVDGGWLLTGEKSWSGLAAWSGVLNVFVKHDDPAGGCSGFIVRQDAPGLQQGPESLTMGMRGIVQNTVFLRDVAVRTEDLLGTVGGGLQVAREAMGAGRLAIAASCLGAMRRCTQVMVRYAGRRRISTGWLLDHPVSRDRL
jgi:alkylation response protein AidB-like acyl-CoA dehydrogenase